MTPAAKLELITQLMNVEVVEDAFTKDGKPILDQYGKQVELPIYDEFGKVKTTSLITPEEARKLLDME